MIPVLKTIEIKTWNSNKEAIKVIIKKDHLSREFAIFFHYRIDTIQT